MPMSERSGSLFRRCLAAVATLVLAGALAGCDQSVLGFGAHTASAASTSAPISPQALRFVAAINKFRRHHGLGNLTAYDNLDDKGVLWSTYMAGGNCPGGDICHSDLTGGIEMQWSLLEENVGSGSPSDDLGAIQLGFQNSPMHAANMLNPQITGVGVGVAISGNTIYVTQEFLAP
jgi:uncharacterized protein YkwD